MGRYAEGTTVSTENSRAEIERILRKYGATKFSYGWDTELAVVQFEASGRIVRFSLPMPDPKAREFTHAKVNQTGATRPRSPAQQAEAYEQATRQRWRALALSIKAKLEAVDVGISTFEREFLAQIVVPTDDGPRTVGEWLAPGLDRVYASGSGLPELMPAT